LHASDNSKLVNAVFDEISSCITVEDSFMRLTLLYFTAVKLID